MIGASLSHYRISAKLGQGGMGEVYRATDETLGRDVAIKVLPEDVASDEMQLARFEREAHLLASLSHSNIAAIHGLVEADGRRFLVLELVEGEDLAERLKRGAIPLDEAIAIAMQIAEALEEAHAHGIVHRDLKPANVMLTAGGKVKVLDFGLAKAASPDAPESPDASQSPTMSAQATAAGIVLGTAAYMAPEQAKGRSADKRADIWSFGVLLYEMLTGSRLFTGDGVAEILAGVLKGQIDLTALPPDTPPALRGLVRRCLERTPRKRLHDIADARLALEDAAAGITDGDAPATRPTGRTRREVVAWSTSALLAVAFATTLWQSPAGTGEPPRVMRATLPLPEDLTIELDGSHMGMPAVSPDGTRIAFGGRRGDGPLYVHVLDLATGTVRRLDETRGGTRPFWSPDGREIGFFTWYALSTISAEGGPVTRLAPARDARGGSWSPNGTILFAPYHPGPLFTVPATGGPVRQATDASQGDDSNATHRFPHFLPDGEHFLYLDRPRYARDNPGASVALGRLGSDEGRPLLDAATNAIYASGYLLYALDGTLMAQPFDPSRLELAGSPQPIVGDVLFDRRFTLAVFSASESGVLAFQAGQYSEESQLVWRDRAGSRVGALGSPAVYSGVGNPRISPDGAWAVMPKIDPSTSSSDLWLYDLRRGTESRLSRDGTDEDGPLFGGDSKSLYFGVLDRTPPFGGTIVRRDLMSGREEDLLTTTDWLSPVSFAGDTLVLASTQLRGLTRDLVLWKPGDDAPEPLLDGPHDESFGQVSPDGRWLAWASDQTGRHEVYVAAFPDLGSRTQVSREGGTQPRWGPQGSELFFLDPENWLTAVELEARAGTVSTGSHHRLFQISEFWTWPYGVAPDGERFLVREPLRGADRPPLTLLTDWSRLLAQTE